MNYGNCIVLPFDTFENKNISEPENDQVERKLWEEISSEKKKKIVALTCFRKGNQKVP